MRADDDEATAQDLEEEFGSEIEKLRTFLKIRQAGINGTIGTQLADMYVTVSFIVDGNVMKITEFRRGETLDSYDYPPDPEKDGFYFLGWEYEGGNGGGGNNESNDNDKSPDVPSSLGDKPGQKPSPDANASTDAGAATKVTSATQSAKARQTPNSGDSTLIVLALALCLSVLTALAVYAHNRR